jgi:peptidoglycan hydrolase-like protein with peptidoglycan-binding domain
MPIGGTIVAAVALAGVLFALVGAIKILSGAKAIKQTVPIMIMLAVIIGVLGVVMVGLALMPLSGALVAAGTLSAVLLVLAASILIISKAGKIKQTLSTMIMLAVIIGVLGGAIALIATQPWQNALVACAAMSVTVLALAAAILILSQIKTIPPTTVATLLLMVTAIAIIGVVVSLIGGMGAAAVMVGLGAIAAGLVLMVAALYLMSGASSGVTALLAACAALVVLAGVMAIFSTVPWDGIVKGLVAIAGVFLILWVAGMLCAPVIGIIIGLAGALVLIGAAVALVGAGVLMIGNGFIAMATGITALGAAMSTSMPSIIAGMQEFILGIIAMIPAFVGGLLSAVVQLLPQVIQAGVDLVVGFLNGLTQNMGRIVQAAFDFVIAFINGLADGIRNNSGKVIAAVWNLITAIISALGQIFKKVVPIGKELVAKLGQGIKNAIGKAVDAVKSLFTKMWNYMKNLVKKFKDVGKEIVNGIVDGIKKYAKKAVDAVKNLGKKLLNGLKDFLGINSPSKAFAELGQWSTIGFGEGMLSELDFASFAGESVGLSAIDGLQGAVDGAEGSIDLNSLFGVPSEIPTDGVIPEPTTDNVKAQQEFINDWYEDTEGWTPLTVDGVSGPQTQAAIKKLQEQLAEELKRGEELITGEFDQATINALEQKRQKDARDEAARNKQTIEAKNDVIGKVETSVSDAEYAERAHEYLSSQGYLNPLDDFKGVDWAAVIDGDLSSLPYLTKDVTKEAQAQANALREMFGGELGDSMAESILSNYKETEDGRLLSGIAASSELSDVLLGQFNSAMDKPGEERAAINEFLSEAMGSFMTDEMAEKYASWSDKAKNEFANNMIEFGNKMYKDMKAGLVTEDDLQSYYGYDLSQALQKAWASGENVDSVGAGSPVSMLGGGLMSHIMHNTNAVEEILASVVSDGIVDGAKTGVSEMGTVLESYDSEDAPEIQVPITPVIDTSKTKTGLDAIGSMIGGSINSSLKTAPALAANISYTMDNQSQNRGFDDVTSSINDLGTSLGEEIRNISKPTYSIGEMVFNDESAMAKAFTQFINTYRRYGRA